MEKKQFKEARIYCFVVEKLTIDLGIACKGCIREIQEARTHDLIDFIDSIDYIDLYDL